MALVLAFLIACGTTAQVGSGEGEVETPETEQVVAPADAPKPVADPEFDLPEGTIPMTLLMKDVDIDTRVGVGSRVDLIAGEGESEQLIAKDVPLLAAKVEERGTRVTFALTTEHRDRLVGAQLPGRPRAVLHE